LKYVDGQPPKVTERIDLCEECARKYNVDAIDEVGFSMADLFSAVKKERQSRGLA